MLFHFKCFEKNEEEKEDLFYYGELFCSKSFYFTLKKILRSPIHTHKPLKRYNKKREMNKHFHFFISAWYTRYVGCKKKLFWGREMKVFVREWGMQREYGRSSRSFYNCVSRSLISSLTICFFCWSWRRLFCIWMYNKQNDVYND